MVLKWINLNPISLPYILHQKIVSPNKIDLWKQDYTSIETVTTYGPHSASISLKSFRIRLIFFLIRTNTIFYMNTAAKPRSFEN